MTDWKEILKKIKADPRYIEGITYGVPRPGHDEGSVANHLKELEETLFNLAPLVSMEEYLKLLVLIHVHDSFKLAGKRITGRQVSLRDPNSHASLGRAFLSEFTDDESLLAIVQFHDEGHALWKSWQRRGRFNTERLQEALDLLPDKDLYLLFTVIDGYTVSKLKNRSPLWFLDQVAHQTGVSDYRAYKALELLGAK